MLLARLAPEVLNPFARTPEREAQLRQALAEILADPEVDLAASPALVAEIEAEICGLGPLQPLVDDPEVADILVNAPDAVFVERAGRLEPSSARLAGTRELIELSERIAALAGRELSVAHPVVDARMPDGVAYQRRHPAGRRAVPVDPQVQPTAPRSRARRCRMAAAGSRRAA